MNQDSLLGRQLGNYRLERPLGRGGMAQVYYAWDVKLNRPVAVKLIDARHRDRPSYARRFVQEAQALAQWRHDHIVQIYYADDEDGLYFFAMEYVAGPDLSQILAQHQQDGRFLSHDEVLRIGQAVAEALDYAHSKGVIHRDVKPANVLVAEEDGRVVLSDFGLALDLAREETGHVVASPRYSAPEQARHSGTTVPQSDLYSLAVMLYEMLVGRVPFDDPSPTSVAVQHVTQEPPPPRSLNPALSSMVDGVLLKALSKNPADRYPSGKALMAELTRALKGTSRQADELLGQQLDEYRLGELLGQGGMARIYRGYDKRLRRNVAIKVIDATYRADADYRARFEREAQAIAQLEHPHIVRLYRYGEVSGLFYMAMQYIEGTDLRSHLEAYRQKEETIPPDEASRIVREIGSALDYAHSKGIIHRDVKPSNVMLDKEGHAYLTDFGLALRADTETQGEIFGSPHYVAPEQAISSAGVVPQSDLYAVGVMLYEMFTGQLPFNAADPLDIAMMHMDAAPTPPREIQPSLDPAMEAVILKAMAKEPTKRFASGAELAQVVERALQRDEAPVLDRETAVTTPSSPTQPQLPVSTKPRTLPPPPAAVQISPGQQTVTPTPAAGKRSGSDGRSCLVFLLVLVLTLGVIFSGFWFFGLERRTVDDLIYLTQNGRLPTLPAPTAMAVLPEPTSTSEPTATTTETATLTVTAVPSATASPTQTPTATASPTLSLMPTATNTATPAATPTASNTPIVSPTPLVIVTREQDEMPMVLIPGATFMMGAAADDEAAAADERSLHQVTVDPFYIDRYEVSVAQYAAFLNTLGDYVNACNGYTCLSTSFETIFSHLTDELEGYVAEPGFADYPVNNVSWHGANAYCEWIGGRLPTEAEWELAARGGDGRLYPWGDTPPDATLAVFDTIFANVQPVDSLPAGASPFDLHHMAGNVWEWVADGYDPIYYDLSPDLNPIGPAVNAFDDRVLRGGGYDSPAEDLRASNREPGVPTEFRGVPNVGFRCALPGEIGP